ncbi:MAG: S-layer homology domain-containing protein, partial [bacterium]
MKKRAISLILVLCLLLGVVPMAALGAGETPFTDVEEGKWYTESVLRANEKGYIKGVSETEFGLNTPTSRGMLVTILHRVEGEPAAEGESFSDVAEGAYYAAAVAWASANGIVKGYPDGTFAPKADLSRQDLAVIFYRYAAFKGYDVTATAELTAYPDADAVSGYAQEAMRWAVATGLVQGDGSGLSPKGTATRAQA